MKYYWRKLTLILYKFISQLWCGVAQYGATWLSNGAAWLTMVRRGSVGSASACWKAGTSSVPLSLQAMRRWREASANVLHKCDWMIECMLENMKNKQKKSGILPPNLYYFSNMFSTSPRGKWQIQYLIKEPS